MPCDFCLFWDSLKLVPCQKLVHFITSKCLHAAGWAFQGLAWATVLFTSKQSKTGCGVWIFGPMPFFFLFLTAHWKS